MGCQNSKLNGDILAIPPKLRPLLWRKIEELRRKRKGSGENNSGTLSKKELLTEGGREESDAFSRDHDSLHENEGLISEKTSSQDHDSVSSSVTQPKATIIVEEKKIVYKEEIIIMEPEKKIEINKEIENQERSVIIYDKEEKGKEEEEKEKEEEEGKEKEKENEREREVKEEDRKEDQKDDEEDEREYIGPSSPSFRVYFIESLQDKEEDDDEDEDEEKEEEEEKLNEGK